MDENEALEYFWAALVSRELREVRKDLLCTVHANSFNAHSKMFAVYERRDAQEIDRRKEKDKRREIVARDRCELREREREEAT
jgi:hypothetical protein